MTETPEHFGLQDTAERLCAGAMIVRGYAVTHTSALLDALHGIEYAAPFRHMVTPGNLTMSVAMTNCGEWGWITDRTGYRYDAFDPQSGRRWPRMPQTFLRLAQGAATVAGYADFTPDACLINRYGAGTKLSLHQDKDEQDFNAPIVSVSLGLPAVFLFGGPRRSDRAMRIPLSHGDVVVWGGPARLRYHGVLPLKPGDHPLLGAYRINLTFRKAR